MKKLLIILVLGLTAWAAWGSGWDSPDFTGRDSGVVAIRDTVRITGAGGTGRIWYDQTGGTWTSINAVASVVGAGGALVQFVASGNSGLGMQTAADYTYQSHLNSNAMAYVPHKIQCSELDLSVAGSKLKADSVSATKGLSLGGGDLLTKIYMQNDSLYIDLSTGAKLQMKPVIIPAP